MDIENKMTNSNNYEIGFKALATIVLASEGVQITSLTTPYAALFFVPTTLFACYKTCESAKPLLFSKAIVAEKPIAHICAPPVQIRMER